MVGSEGLWPADGGLDARLLQHWDAVDGALDVAHEHVPVQLKQTERKVLLDLRDGSRHRRGQVRRQAHVRSGMSKQDLF